jgi:uncharacterized damage-inducible protein DinB
MNPSCLSAPELIAWNDSTAKQWQSFVTANAAALSIPCDIFSAKTAGQLLHHIVSSELRYAEILAGLQVTDYDSLPYSTPDEIFSIHQRALVILHALLADASYDWTRQLEFNTLTAGRRRSSCRSILFHSMLHGIRHYAQLATLVRQAGFSPKLAVDYLLMDSQPVCSPASA